jgi:hypothetical protein
MQFRPPFEPNQLQYTRPEQYQVPPQSPQPSKSGKPTKQRSPLLWVIVALLIGFLFGYAAHTPNSQESTPTTSANQPTQVTTLSQNTPTSQPTQIPATPTKPPTPTPLPNDLGQTFTSGNWQVTVNSIKTSQGGQYDSTPKAGDTYLLINFTAKNIGASNQDMSPIYFTLRNDQGDTYDIAYISVPSNPRGTVVAGQQLRGDLSYEAPKSLHPFILQFDDPKDYDHSQIVQWSLTV